MVNIPGIETGDTFENVPCMPGHFDTPQTPNRCLCCGKEYWYLGPTCICRHVERWYQDELRNVACEVHIAEKVKDGLFRT
jgi:hypothetical protein